jgi:NitT/TauT family transport system ATP-binding protein
METRPTVFLVTHDLREAAFLATRILSMSSRPGRIAEDRVVDFARPRTIDTTYQEGFNALTHALRTSIFAARNQERVGS